MASLSAPRLSSPPANVCFANSSVNARRRSAFHGASSSNAGAEDAGPDEAGPDEAMAKPTRAPSGMRSIAPSNAARPAAARLDPSSTMNIEPAGSCGSRRIVCTTLPDPMTSAAGLRDIVTRGRLTRAASV
jgi:hypothetical protein